MVKKVQSGIVNTGFPVETSNIIRKFEREYSRTRKPIDVNFRNIVDWIKVGERATHYLHPYPAKLLPHIAHFFLASEDYLSGASVLDPFGGSGTVALEAIISGRDAYYCDANPFASLLAKVKTKKIDTFKIKSLLNIIRFVFFDISDAEIVSFNNIDYWFDKKAIFLLSQLKLAIDVSSSESYRDFFLICFSAAVRKVSHTDPRLSVPVYKENTEYLDAKICKNSVWKVFSEVVNKNINRMEEYNSISQNGKFFFSGGCAKKIVLPESQGAGAKSLVDMVITSPPYGGAQKYVRSSSLSLGWLGMTKNTALRDYEEMSIGREHYKKHEVLRGYDVGVKSANKLIAEIYKDNPLRAHIAANYLLEMRDVINSVYGVLRRGGYFALVIGNNQVCGRPFVTSSYLREYCEAHGMELAFCLIDEIKSRGLMTKRNKTAGLISREWVFLFRKK